jgi:hypothetical protein
MERDIRQSRQTDDRNEREVVRIYRAGLDWQAYFIDNPLDRYAIEIY